MRKSYLKYAGIVSAIILAIMFAGILMTGSFTIFPAVTVDPIPDHAAGDLVIITGTTNLKENTRLELEITSASPLPERESRVGATDAYIVRSGGMTNTWSGALDTSAIPPGEYRVKAYPLNTVNVSYSRGDLLATSRFTLTNATPDPDRITRRGEQHEIEFIKIDHIGTIFRGEKILVTGTTNLPAETELLYIVIPRSNTSVLKIDPKTGMREVQQGFTRSGLTPVLAGAYEGNHWSFAIDTTEFIQDEYEIIVTTDSVSSDKIGKEGTFRTTSMTVLEADLSLPPLPGPAAGSCQIIRIDPIPNVPTGKIWTITGTTSLQPGTELLMQVLPVEFDIGINPATGNISGALNGAMGTTEVVPGSGGNNTWSLEMDPSRLPPNEYLVNVSNDRIDSRTYETRYGNAYCSRRITITGDTA
ncbi:hypothetical protein Metfor_2091 [Methanoregula formicica SMSP]|uniref:Uncharacterized protein n=2 Tax=Methanoregula formicica TaxID=882104 RepID=L0HIG4_METFS|nr:hypothetical protein Metfor_2091 [Methanoregula formicica SMSP]